MVVCPAVPALTALADLERRLFTKRRIRIFGGALLAPGLLLFVRALVSGHSALAPRGGPGAIDFSHFYVAATLARSGHAAAVYDYAAYSAGQQALFGAPHGAYFHFLYPPTSLLFIFVLGLMPFFVAFAAWVGGTLLLYEAAAYAIAPRAATLIAAAAPAVVAANALLGQDGFLTAGLIGLTLLFVEKRPALAGMFLGLLIYKPHFGVLFPLALLAGRHWKVIASATATVLILAAITTVAFGPDVWTAYFASLGGFDARLSPDPRVWIMFQSVFGLLRWCGAAPLLALSAHLVFAAVVGAIVCAVWFRPAPYPLKAAALCVGAVAATPYVLPYDLCILTMAGAFLVQDGLRRGFRPSEPTILLCCALGSDFFPWPIGPALCVALLGLVIRRLLADRARLRAPSLPAAAS